MIRYDLYKLKKMNQENYRFRDLFKCHYLAGKMNRLSFFLLPLQIYILFFVNIHLENVWIISINTRC